MPVRLSLLLGAARLGTITEKVSKLCRTGSQPLTPQSQTMKTTERSFEKWKAEEQDTRVGKRNLSCEYAISAINAENGCYM